MKKVLWVSRHEMTAEQLNDLKRIYGEVTVEKLDATVKRAEEITAIPADIYAVVLPTDMIADLLHKTTNPVISAVSERVKEGTVLNPATGKEEAQYVFRHVAWKQFVRIEIETVTL